MEEFEDNVIKLCHGLQETLIKKNTDYGDSYVKSVNKHGNVVTLVRLEDKLNRLEQLIKSKEQNVKDESIEDTLLDLAGYCILELERRKRNEN